MLLSLVKLAEFARRLSKRKVRPGVGVVERDGILAAHVGALKIICVHVEGRYGDVLSLALVG